ncbi:hypothetical protein ACTOVL_03690 [Arcanobacterium canis]
MMRPAFVGALVTGLATVALTKLRRPSWDRTSFSGSTVSLTGGLATATGAIASSGAVASAPALIASVTGACAGYVDDHLEESFGAKGKGFKGHLGALSRGEVTSGAVKILGVGMGAGAAGWLISSRSTGISRAVDAGVNTVLIAGMANLLNLFDLRPGRALKVALAVSTPLAVAGNKTAAGVLGTSVASLPTDLAGTTMLGDLGANALGAQVGVAAAQRLPLLGRFLVTAGVVGLTYASEKISFSKVIDECAPLRFVDQLGRP